jgi:hypothetical protein
VVFSSFKDKNKIPGLQVPLLSLSNYTKTQLYSWPKGIIPLAGQNIYFKNEILAQD